MALGESARTAALAVARDFGAFGSILLRQSFDQVLAMWRTLLYVKISDELVNRVLWAIVVITVIFTFRLNPFELAFLIQVP